MDQIMTKATEFDALTPEVWSAAWYPTLLEALPFNDLVARDYEGDIRQLGDKVNISSFPQFAQAEVILENQKVDADGITASASSLTVDSMIVKDFIVTNLAQIQSLDASAALRDLAFFSIMKKMQSIIINKIVPSASSPDHTISYTSATTLALADMIAAKKLLDLQNVPDDGSRAFVTGANQWNDIFNITGLTSRDFVDGSPLSSGSLPGRILGFNPKMTTEVGTNTHFFHPIFMQVAVQKGLGVQVFDQGVSGHRSVRVNSTLLMGAAQLSGLRVVTVS